MLDGLLGRSAFSSKCKSLIKPTRTRIEALRKRSEAKQRFLKQDLAKLLANGLDLNAYGRTEEFIAGLNLLSCYTFIDQSCEYIYKQLSIMNKLGQCPEECRETVASLMFAAGRFSDLPELRSLRDVFQDRYGNGLKCFVNQVFVEKVDSKPPVVEKKIKLLQDIAAEFSIQWDSKGFKQRMEKPSTLAQDQPKKLGPLSLADDKYKLPNEINLFRKNDQRSKEKVQIEHVDQGAKLHNNGNGNGNRREVFVGREDTHHKERIEHHHHDGNANIRRKEVFMVRKEKHTRKEDDNGYFSNTGKGFSYKNPDRMPKDDDTVNLGRNEKHGFKQNPFTSSSSSSSKAETIETKDNNDDHLKREKPRFLYNEKLQSVSSGNLENDVKNVPEEETSNGVKSRYNNFLPPPPYVKPNIPPLYSKPENSEKKEKEADHNRNYQNDIPLPKPRSIRRKHNKSSSSLDEDVGTSEDARVFKKISSSRRKERKGLQILFDDQHYHHKDHEEKMMDKLLLHYSSKNPLPDYDDIAKLRKKKSRSRSKDEVVDMIVRPVRSISLPHEPSGELEPEKKVFARANSFHPDNQAKHVHPKLPDYDDLAARFAALRGQ